MALSDIINKINADAESEIRKILEKAEAEASSIISEGKEEAEKISRRMLESGSGKAVKVRETVIAMAKLQNKKEILAVKQGIMDAVYEEVKRRIAAFGDKEYGDIAERIIASTREEKIDVIAGENERKRLNTRFIAGIKAGLKKRGSGVKVSLGAEKADLKDGFILRSGRIQIDCSHENLVRSLREETIDEVAAILFG